MTLVCDTKTKYPIIYGGLPIRSLKTNPKISTNTNHYSSIKAHDANHHSPVKARDANHHLSVEAYDSECALDVPGTVCSTDETVNDMKIYLRKMDMQIPNTDIVVVRDVKKILHCTTELDIIKNSEFKRNSSEANIKASMLNFKSDGPGNSTKLLNNHNIDTPLNALTYQHTGFYHMKFQMICFAGIREGKLWKIINGVGATPTELGKINLVMSVINRGKDTFGVVLNTDTRAGAGIHWFSLFCDFRKRPFTVEYFNSSGNMPMPQVHDWLNKTTSYIKDAGYADTKKVILSKFPHQIDSETECGPYSVYYIWSRLNGVSSDTFQKNRVKDSEMIKFRKLLFKS